MTKVSRSTDCGNSPKNQLLEDLTIAIARGDVSLVEELVTRDVRWQQAGKRALVSLDAVRKALERAAPAAEIAIDHVLSHGRAGAVNGTMTATQGGRSIAFCHVFEFQNAKGTQVRSVVTYAIPSPTRS